MRRLANVVVGAALVGAGAYLLIVHTGADVIYFKIVLAAAALIAGGLLCLGTGITGR